ncbi:MAG: hypothetical protein RR231_09670, partial [Acinetobacter sp.]
GKKIIGKCEIFICHDFHNLFQRFVGSMITVAQAQHYVALSNIMIKSTDAPYLFFKNKRLIDFRELHFLFILR